MLKLSLPLVVSPDEGLFGDKQWSSRVDHVKNVDSGYGSNPGGLEVGTTLLFQISIETL